jgi:hypothetical protein
LEFGEEYRGSWILDAAITMAGPVGTVYLVLKGVSELPKIVDGLADLKGRITEKVIPAVNRVVGKTLHETFDRSITHSRSGSLNNPKHRLQALNRSLCRCLLLRPIP